jgi:hypothetical protein
LKQGVYYLRCTMHGTKGSDYSKTNIIMITR